MVRRTHRHLQNPRRLPIHLHLPTMGRTLQLLSLALLLLALSHETSAEHSICLNMTASPTLEKFVDPLPIPKVIDISDGKQIVIGAYKIRQQLHRDLPLTDLYAYGTSQETATYPGPTLLARVNNPTRIRWENHLYDKEHLFVIDRTIHWAEPPNEGIPTVVHLHGSEAPSFYDGHPTSWFTASGDHGPTFTTQNYTYPNEQTEAMLWYHDHTIGMTRVNVAAGLAGVYLLTSEAEEALPLPKGRFEVPLVFQDRQFWANGSINYPDQGEDAEYPNWCPDYYGDTMLVNGKVWPYLNVYPAMYRFRMLVGTNARFFNLSFSEPSLEFLQIGTEGGFLPKPVPLKNLVMAPGYRTDIIVDFSNIPVGTTIYLNNSAIPFFPDGNEDEPIDNSTSQKSVMAFNVVAPPEGKQRPDFKVPANLAPAPDMTLRDSDIHRNITMRKTANPLVFELGNKRYDDPATEIPTLGTTEIWTLYNFVGSTHPIHLHLVNFVMLDMQSYNLTKVEAEECTFDKDYPDPLSCFTEPRQPPADFQTGWKDTVIVYERKVTRLLVRWKPRNEDHFSFDATLGPGYVWHCHMLEHEDNDMMRPLLVLKP